MSGELVCGRRGFLRGVAMGAAATVIGGCAHGDPHTIRVAAGEDGGGYLAFARLLAAAAARGDTLAIDVQVTPGSRRNLELLAAGEVDVALTQQDTALAFTAERPGSLVAIARVYDNYLQIAASASSNLRVIDDLRGRRVSLGRTGSGTFVALPEVLAAVGIDTVRDVDVTPLGLRDAAKALRDGSVDAVGWIGAVPTPAFTESGPVRLVDLASIVDPVVTTLGAPFRRLTVPGGAYAGSPPVSTVGLPNLLLTRPDLDESVASDLVQLLLSSAADLVPDGARGAQNLRARSFIDTGPFALHPGAVSRYRSEHR